MEEAASLVAADVTVPMVRMSKLLRIPYFRPLKKPETAVCTRFLLILSAES